MTRALVVTIPQGLPPRYEEALRGICAAMEVMVSPAPRPRPVKPARVLRFSAPHEKGGL